MQGLSNDYYHISASLAVQIIDAAQAGDEAAGDVVRFSGEELGWLAVSVTRQIGMENDEVEVIQSWSIFKAGELIDKPMRKILLNHVPGAKIRKLACLPVIGPVVLGMQIAGMDGYSVRPAMIQSLVEVIGELVV